MKNEIRDYLKHSKQVKKYDSIKKISKDIDINNSIINQNNPQFIFEIGNKASTFEFTSFAEEQSETLINNNIILILGN